MQRAPADLLSRLGSLQTPPRPCTAFLSVSSLQVPEVKQRCEWVTQGPLAGCLAPAPAPAPRLTLVLAFWGP